MAGSKEIDKFLKAYREVAERVRRIELETKVARITLEDVTTRLGLDLGPESPPGETGRGIAADAKPYQSSAVIPSPTFAQTTRLPTGRRSSS